MFPAAIKLPEWDYQFKLKGESELSLSPRDGFRIGDIVYWEDIDTLVGHKWIKRDIPIKHFGMVVGFLPYSNVVAFNNDTDTVDGLKEIRKTYMKKGVMFYDDYGIWGVNLTARSWAKDRTRLGRLTQFGSSDIKTTKIWEKYNMKNIWEVIVIDKSKDEIVCREIIIDGDEKSACSKVSITFAEKLKSLVFNNLVYITKNLGSYEK